MASRPFVDSIKEAQEKRTTIRESTQEFLIKASQIIQSSNHSHEHPLNRYYRLEINSLLDPDEDNIKSIQKLSKDSAICIKCGSGKSLRLRNRKAKNKSWTRKYCRPLRSQLVVLCDKCQDRQKLHLKGRRAVLAQLKNRGIETKKGRPNTSTHLIEKPNKSTPDPETKSRKQKQPSQPAKLMVKRRAKHSSTTPSIEKKPLQFSSRLRAFDCLLEP